MFNWLSYEKIKNIDENDTGMGIQKHIEIKCIISEKIPENDPGIGVARVKCLAEFDTEPDSDRRTEFVVQRKTVYRYDFEQSENAL